MKTSFLAINLLIGLLSVSIPARTTPVEPVRTMEVPVACDVPPVNGYAEACYSSYQTMYLWKVTGWEGEMDLTAGFRICWDYLFLYLLVDIVDDIEHPYYWGTGNPWEFDNFEIFLQLDTNTVDSRYNETTVQLRVCRGLDSVEMEGHVSRSDFSLFIRERPDTGWVTEIAIPWTAVLAEGSDPEDMVSYTDRAIGFELHASDSDNSDGDTAIGNRDAIAVWDCDDGPPGRPQPGPVDEAWHNTRVFGYVSLMDIHGCGLEIDVPAKGRNSLQAFPNPASDKIRFINVNRSCRIVISSVEGREVINAEYRSGQELDVSSLTSGIYVAVFDGNESVKFVKR